MANDGCAQAGGVMTENHGERAAGGFPALTWCLLSVLALPASGAADQAGAAAPGAARVPAVASAPVAASTPATASTPAVAGMPAEGGGSPAAAALWQKQIDSATLEPDRAVSVKQVTLGAGLARVRLVSGTLIPVSAVGGRTVEAVFVGEGHISLDPPDSVEAGQLDLFTGRSRLDEDLSAAVLVMGLDNAVNALLRRPAAVPAAPLLATAQEMFAQWKKRERKVLDVEGRILGRAAGDPALAGYFAALCHGAKLGTFYYIFDPQEQEQVDLGRFVPSDATDKEKKKMLKEVARAQRRGHLLGFDLEELGTPDTWVGAAPRDAQGLLTPGAAAFEPASYDLDLDLADADLRLTGRARIELTPMLRGARTVRLRLARDLVVQRVASAPRTAETPRTPETPESPGGSPQPRAPGAPAGGAGDGSTALFFHRNGNNLTVLLPRAAEPGETVILLVEYAGSLVDKDWSRYELLSTLDWYPHAGAIDRARYRATFRWPQKLALVGSGRRVDAGTAAGGRHWERRALDNPSVGFSFEIGKFQVRTVQAGHVKLTMAFDATSSHLNGEIRDEMTRAAADALTYYEGLFGPYPLDELTVVTAPHEFSQGTEGLVTLSDLMMGDYGFFNVLLGLPDRRAVIAHEVAHQWWGDGVGWASYRDQWISEALATYCALLFTRDRLDAKHPVAGLTARWRESLTATIADGRNIEAVGPVVLGSRLFSSLSDDAYQAIVYDKGAVVLGTLAAMIGPDVFPRVLQQVYRASVNRNLSTEQLLALIGAITGRDLSSFANQFIYGTGLRTVFYQYRFEAKPDGGHRVAGTTRQEPLRQVHYRVVRSAAGALDVARTAVAEVGVASADLPVPVDIDVYDPARPPAEHGKKGEVNATVRGRLLLSGESKDFSLDVPGEPKGFVLDRRAEVFALFLDESKHPRRALLAAALIAADQGREREAETLFDKALATDEKIDAAYWEAAQRARRLLTSGIQLGRARLLLQQGRDAEAERALARVDLPANPPDKEADEEDLLTAWLDVHRGRFDRAFRRLDQARLASPEGTLLLAIAAQATGHADKLAEALRTARRMGADTGLLVAAAPAPGTATRQPP
jgi:hypothetical protein